MHDRAIQVFLSYQCLAKEATTSDRCPLCCHIESAARLFHRYRAPSSVNKVGVFRVRSQLVFTDGAIQPFT